MPAEFSPSKYPPFDGHPVTLAGAKMTGQNPVLRRAAHVEGPYLQVGDVITVAIRCEVLAIDHRPINNNEGELHRVAQLGAKEATLHAGDEADDAINATLARYQAQHDAPPEPPASEQPSFPELESGEAE